MRESKTNLLTLQLVLVIALINSSCREAPAPTKIVIRADGKIPITTCDPQALTLFIEGRDLAEKLRAADAREKFEAATELDPNLALAHLGLATTAPTAQQFFDSLKIAVFVSEQVSAAERLMILGLQAAANADPAGQLARYVELIELFPDDERAHHLHATLLFGRQEYGEAIRGFERAIEINPDFSPPYNLLGYSYRSLGKLDKAEAAFRKYIALLPTEPNPYDSYAELLMKSGRFEESIANYETALERDSTFVASYIGIGTNKMLLGDFGAARKAFAALEERARDVRQRRRAVFWTVMSFLHERRFDEALVTVSKLVELAQSSGDRPALAGDLNLLGQVLFEMGQYEQASSKLEEAVEVINSADVSDEVKKAQERNQLFFSARFAVGRGDLEKARAEIEQYRETARLRAIPFELRRAHELAGLLALAEKRPVEALAELQQANRQDPRVLFLEARALSALGRRAEASAMADKSAHFNGLSGTYAFVRPSALELLESLERGTS